MKFSIINNPSIQKTINIRLVVSGVMIVLAVVFLLFSFTQSGEVICTLFLFLVLPLGIAGIYRTRQNLIQRSDNSKFPIIANLIANLRGDNPGYTILQEIDSELMRNYKEFVGRVGNYENHLYITENWLIHSTLGTASLLDNILNSYLGGGVEQESLAAMRLADIVWYYKSKQTSMLGRYIQSEIIALRLHDKYGKILVFEGKDNEVDDALLHVAQRLPNARAGFDTALETAWKANPTSLLSSQS